LAQLYNSPDMTALNGMRRCGLRIASSDRRIVSTVADNLRLPENSLQKQLNQSVNQSIICRLKVTSSPDRPNCALRTVVIITQK